MIRCISIRKDTPKKTCNRFLADFVSRDTTEINCICPTCHTNWNIKQDGNGNIFFKEINKTGKSYDDDSVAISVNSSFKGEF